MKKFYVVDEERLFSDIVAAAARVQGYEPIQFFDASSAYHHFQECTMRDRESLFWIDMYLLPGSDDFFRSVDGEHDEYRVGLKLATKVVQEKFVHPDWTSNLTLYSGHITKGLWADIRRFCDEHRTQSFQKRAGTEFPELMSRIPPAETDDDES